MSVQLCFPSNLRQHVFQALQCSLLSSIRICANSKSQTLPHLLVYSTLNCGSQLHHPRFVANHKFYVDEQSSKLKPAVLALSLQFDEGGTNKRI